MFAMQVCFALLEPTIAYYYEVNVFYYSPISTAYMLYRSAELCCSYCEKSVHETSNCQKNKGNLTKEMFCKSEHLFKFCQTEQTV